jgi:hypothetical protein
LRDHNNDNGDNTDNVDHDHSNDNTNHGSSNQAIKDGSKRGINKFWNLGASDHKSWNSFTIANSRD